MRTRINDNPNEGACSTQRERILEHLRRGDSITPVEALDLYGCFRLSGRIIELRQEGYLIHTEMVKDARTGKRYARYSMV